MIHTGTRSTGSHLQARRKSVFRFTDSGDWVITVGLRIHHSKKSALPAWPPGGRSVSEILYSFSSVRVIGYRRFSELHHRAARQRHLAGDDGRSTLEEMECRILLRIRIF